MLTHYALWLKYHKKHGETKLNNEYCCYGSSITMTWNQIPVLQVAQSRARISGREPLNKTVHKLVSIIWPIRQLIPEKTPSRIIILQVMITTSAWYLVITSSSSKRHRLPLYLVPRLTCSVRSCNMSHCITPAFPLEVFLFSQLMFENFLKVPNIKNVSVLAIAAWFRSYSPVSSSIPAAGTGCIHSIYSVLFRKLMKHAVACSFPECIVNGATQFLRY